MTEYQINKRLAEERDIMPETQTAIEIVGQRLFNILARPEMYADKDQISDIIQGFEYVLQHLWGFDMHWKMHRYWMEVKGCTCPKMDNIDYVGTTYRIFSENCPYHGLRD